MNEISKTLGFVGVAVVALAVGVWMHRPAPEDTEALEVVNAPLFKNFKEPRDAKSLEIVDYDEDTAEIKAFKVAQVKGLWVIPSHEDYPADAADQLADAAASVIEARTLNLVSDDPKSHETYGVVDPDPKKLTVGSSGVGSLVTMESGAGKKLAQLIIGKAVDKAKPDLRYVRRPNQDQVYVASIKTDKLSTKFEDWIEKDLLKLNAWDVEEVTIDDYSIEEVGLLDAKLHPRSRMELGFDSKDSKWRVIDLEQFVSRKEGYRSEPLAEDEELNSQKLNDLKTALDDLKIVDVRRKPAGLTADLRAGEKLLENEEALQSLLVRGFRAIPEQNAEGETVVQIYSNEGETHCGTKDGVEYILRFGRIAGATGESGEKDTAEGEDAKEKVAGEAADAKSGDSDKGTGANRFIMVAARFNEELIPKPELQPLPGESAAEEAKPADSKADDAKAKKTSRVESSLADAEGLLAQAGAAKASGKGNAKAKADEKAKDAGKTKTADKKSDDKPKTNDKASAAEEKPSDEKPAAKPKSDPETERIKKENERKQKEYDDKVKKGEEKVKDLSDRFADWYYVISDKTYQKIHLSREDIVKKKSEDKGTSEDVLSDQIKKLPE